MSTPQTPSQPEEGDWFFDMIIGFLRSPRWKTPVMSFIDEYCTVFDDEDENKLEFTKIHHDFKKIVEDLLEELMAELGVSDTQFVEACQKAQENSIHKKIVDQIMAVDNFLAFKKLMVKRNQELNKQAIEMFEKLSKHNEENKQSASATGAPPKITQPVQEPAPQDQPPQVKNEEQNKKMTDELREVMRVAHSLERAEEEEMLKKAIEESQRLTGEEQRVKDEEEEMLRQAIEMSNREEEERKKKSVAEEQLSDQFRNSSAAESEIIRQRTALEQKERELKALIEEQKIQKALADKALGAKEAELAQRERALTEQSQKTALELEEERKKIAEERKKALEEAKRQGKSQMKANPAASAEVPAPVSAQTNPTTSVSPAQIAPPVIQKEVALQQTVQSEQIFAEPVQAPVVAAKRVEAQNVVEKSKQMAPEKFPAESLQHSKIEAKHGTDPKKVMKKSTLPPPSDLPEIGSSLPEIGGGKKFGGLGGVYGRAGAFDVDENSLKRAKNDLAKLNRIEEPDFGQFEEEKKEEDGRSMLQVMQDKRKATEAALQAKMANQPVGESVDERKARLEAQRDLLRRMKEEKRQKELNEFNSKLEVGNAPSKNLAEEFKNMDANKQLPQGAASEIDRRRLIYKNVRKEIGEADQAAKEKEIARKMNIMETKVQQRERERREQEELLQKQAAEAENLRKHKIAQNKNFLDNLEAFNVE